ncbi:hypothetical protein M409DRAFT_55037 [Zasmidium cellare ATCC 36951]|uniref:Zn(2)-C6 fungal-type domain-containing protein n=1 Tax=Zasmidium cellare ATCC 36951 TaxID=1080233 RepID=A0A6A6CJM6_ZASCE|nr:uncharacterized protein M409DRAFT_55037 [Zasmidium cellare ATCC 36951]KAF2166162.1 hypothetical protein M409DRAFT_55037 [Zasmidium cellare ATCC 36951]
MTADGSTQRASQVCNNCKTRKKGCDKQLPTCGYCSKRGLECRYDRTPDSRPEGASVGSIADLLSCSTGPALDGVVNLQVCHAIHRTGISIDELTSRFFHYFHQWLPIISPATFRETAAKYQHGVPPADFSMLLLSMYVIVLRPIDGSLVAPKDDIQPKDLYHTAKVFLSHVQTRLCASILLVQATILIAEYEYVCGKPGGAYVSLGLALRMGYVLELQHSVMPDSLHKGPHLQHSRAEQRNLWWGIVVMERLIVLELPSKGPSLSTRYPCGDFEFPVDLNDNMNCKTPNDKGPGGHHDHVIKDDFANIVKACFYLDAVLTAMDCIDVPETRSDLDAQILGFLRDAMGSSAHAPHSETLTIATRSLMLRHQTILNRLPPEKIEQNRSTEDALDSAATMILEAAYDHSEHFDVIDALSLSCFYCLDVAFQQYEKRPNLKQQSHITQAADISTPPPAPNTHSRKPQPSRNRGRTTPNRHRRRGPQRHRRRNSQPLHLPHPKHNLRTPSNRKIPQTIPLTRLSERRQITREDIIRAARRQRHAALREEVLADFGAGRVPVRVGAAASGVEAVGDAEAVVGAEVVGAAAGRDGGRGVAGEVGGFGYAVDEVAGCVGGGDAEDEE